jgi:predicted GNAT family acetyltransferase
MIENTINVQHSIKGNKGKFFIEREGIQLAEMVYTMPDPGKMIIEHTEVDDQLRGQNVGNQLVKAGVDFARAHNIKIIPLCPFANSVFKKKPEYGDVLYT